MPELSGSEFIKQARQEKIVCPFILLSGLDYREIKKSIGQTSGVEIFTKPIKIEEFINKIGELLSALESKQVA